VESKVIYLETVLQELVRLAAKVIFSIVLYCCYHSLFISQTLVTASFSHWTASLSVEGQLQQLGQCPWLHNMVLYQLLSIRAFVWWCILPFVPFNSTLTLSIKKWFSMYHNWQGRSEPTLKPSFLYCFYAADISDHAEGLHLDFQCYQTWFYCCSQLL